MLKQLSSLIILFSLSFIFAISGLYAQKVAITGMRTDNPDGFSFVILTDLPAGEKLFFTDRNYQAASNGFAAGESVFTYTVPASGHATGAVVLISEVSNNNTTVTVASGTAGTISPTNGMDFRQQGEGLYAFGASNPADPTGTMTEIYSYVHAGTNPPPANQNPANDANCPCSVDFVAFTHRRDNLQYTGNKSNVTKANFMNNSRWTKGDPTNTNNPLNTTGFTNLQFGGTTFPVEWLSFEAKVEGSLILLNWATASEINNDYFIIQRSADGQVFEEIGTIEGVGTSQEVSEYKFTDDSPFLGISHYRIRQVDYDGAFDFSDVISVELTSTIQSVRLYPNPFTDKLFVESNGGFLKIYNLTGQQVAEFELEAGRTQIDLSQLKSGLFIVDVRDESGERVVRRIVK